MFNLVRFDSEIDNLLVEGRAQEAEERLLNARAELEQAGNSEDLEHVVARLAHYYSAPNTENLKKAESYFLEREVLSRTPYAKSQTAMFYFYVVQDLQKTIMKVDEISDLKDDIASYYSALALKGHALIKLGMIAEADKVLTEVLLVISANPSGLPYGDEMNLLETAMSNPALVSTSRKILNLILPRIRSKEYRTRAETLLKG